MNTTRIIIGALALLAMTFIEPSQSFGQRKAKGGPPHWAPAHGHKAQTRHVYFPAHNFYFDVQRNVYIYPSGNLWLVRASLPSFYSKVDLRSATMVELDMNTDAPHRHNHDHVVKYNGKAGPHGSKNAKPKASPAKTKASPAKTKASPPAKTKESPAKGASGKNPGNGGGQGKGGKSKGKGK